MSLAQGNGGKPLPLVLEVMMLELVVEIRYAAGRHGPNPARAS